MCSREDVLIRLINSDGTDELTVISICLGVYPNIVNHNKKVYVREISEGTIKEYKESYDGQIL